MENSQNRQDAENQNQEYPYGYGLGLRSRLKLLLNKANIRKLSLTLLLSSLAIIYLFALYQEGRTPNLSTEIFQEIVYSIAFFLTGSTGYIVIYRAKGFSRTGLYSKLVKISNFHVMILFWGLSFFELLMAIYKIFLALQNFFARA